MNPIRPAHNNLFRTMGVMAAGVALLCPPLIARADDVGISNKVQWITFSDFLMRVDSAGATYATAGSSLQKDEIAKATQEIAATLIAGKSMALRATITDIRMPRDGVAVITFKDLDTGAYGLRKQNVLHAGTSGKVELQLPREEALKLVKGMRIELAGEAAFKPSDRGLDAIMASANALTSIQFRGGGHSLGYISLEKMRWRFAAPAAK